MLMCIRRMAVCPHASFPLEKTVPCFSITYLTHSPSICAYANTHRAGPCMCCPCIPLPIQLLQLHHAVRAEAHLPQRLWLRKHSKHTSSHGSCDRLYCGTAVCVNYIRACLHGQRPAHDDKQLNASLAEHSDMDSGVKDSNESCTSLHKHVQACSA